MKHLGLSTEQTIIDFIAAQSSARLPERRRIKTVLKGIGDDCAVLAATKQALVVTTDTMVEGVHFKRNYTAIGDAERFIGWKLIASNVSDVLAMGCQPRYALTSLSIPKTINVSGIKEMIRGMNQCSRFYGIQLIGGDITGSTKHLCLNCTLFGIAPEHKSENKCIYRNGARPGDTIYLLGTLGYSSAGLSLLLRGKNVPKRLIEAHLKPRPPEKAIQYIRSKIVLSSMIDISDGLSMDLHRICRESKVGALVTVEALPGQKRLAQYIPETYLQHQLYGGEEYSLLFTSPKIIDRKIINYCQKKYSTAPVPIGTVTKKRRIELCYNGKKHVFKQKGFNHF